MLTKVKPKPRKSAVFVSIPAIGHLAPLLQQARELLSRGWIVSIASTEEYSWYIKQYCPDANWISLGSLAKEQDAESLAFQVDREKNVLKGRYLSSNWLNTIWLIMFDQLLAAVKDCQPDVFVVDILTSAGIDVALSLKVPFIINTPLPLPAVFFLNRKILPVSNCTPMLHDKKSIHDMGTWEQFTYPLRRKLSSWFFELMVRKQFNRMRAKHTVSKSITNESFKDKLILVNSAFGLEYSRPVPPSVQLVGPMIPKSFKELPEDVIAWLDKEIPTVFLSLGTLAPYTSELILKLVEALDTQKFQVLWALNKKYHILLPAKLPSTFRIESWLPSTLAVFSHPNVHVFVSHCGGNSVHESLYFGTPIVGIPIFADQEDYAYRIQDASVGVRLDKTSFTADELRNAVFHVIHSKEVLLATEKIQACLQLAGGVSRAADLIEQVVYFGMP